MYGVFALLSDNQERYLICQATAVKSITSLNPWVNFLSDRQLRVGVSTSQSPEEPWPASRTISGWCLNIRARSRLAYLIGQVRVHHVSIEFQCIFSLPSHCRYYYCITITLKRLFSRNRVWCRSFCPGPFIPEDVWERGSPNHWRWSKGANGSPQKGELPNLFLILQ